MTPVPAMIRPTSSCNNIEEANSSASSSPSYSSLPQHEACLRHMLSEEDRVVADSLGYRLRRRPSSDNDNGLGHLTVWRERVAQWVYTVVDHVDADRSTVYNVLLLLDAYLDAILARGGSSHNFPNSVAAVEAIDAPTYQLLAMSCLYLVLRLRDGGAHRLSVEQLVSMSRNDSDTSSSSATASNAVITPARIARTMKSIVRTLESTWRRLVFAPSPGEFVVAYVEQMQHTTNAGSTSSKIDDLLQATRWSAILDDATYLAELSVCDTYLRYDRPSVIAYAALLNVLRCHESAEESNAATTLKQDLQSLQVLTGYVNVSKTTVKTIYSRLGYVRSQSLDAAMAPTSSHGDQQGEEAEAANNTVTVANIVPQDDDDDDDEVENEAEEEVEKQEVVAVAPTAAAIVSAATSPSPPTTTGGVKRRISAVVSYDELLAVVDATLPSASTTTSSDSSDSEEDDQDLPMPSSSSSSSSSGMKRVRSYSSDLSSFAAPGDEEVAKRTRLLESHP